MNHTLKTAYILWWELCDEINEALRRDALQNAGWVDRGLLLNQWKKEDATKKNRREYFLDYGEWPR